jgi:hypothetical protein
MQRPNRFLYIFLDEAGNLDFSPNGTRYFLLSSVAKERPFFAYKELTELKYDLVEAGMDIEYFHASEDTPIVRDKVFEIIRNNLTGIRVDSLVVEKRKTGPTLRTEERFYPEMLGYLLRYLLNGYNLSLYSEVIVFTDRIPVHKKRKAVEKAVKTTLANKLPKGTQYRVFHHESKSNFDLQIADYCNWAIYRKWDREDKLSYKMIRSVIRSEFDMFKTGTTYYY